MMKYICDVCFLMSQSTEILLGRRFVTSGIGDFEMSENVKDFFKGFAEKGIITGCDCLCMVLLQVQTLNEKHAMLRNCFEITYCILVSLLDG